MIRRVLFGLALFLCTGGLQAKYPKCKLVVEGTKLVLKTPSGLGMLLIFR